MNGHDGQMYYDHLSYTPTPHVLGFTSTIFILPKMHGIHGMTESQHVIRFIIPVHQYQLYLFL